MNTASFMKRSGARRGSSDLLCLMVSATAIVLAGSAHAGSTDLAKSPLLSSATPVVKPNVLFILDDSGSMQNAFMPDDMSDTAAYGYKSTQCNGVSYDPLLSYSPPLDSHGDPYLNASFTAAWKDGFRGASGGTVDLTGSTYYAYTGAQPLMEWKYKTTGSVDTSTTFYKECRSRVGNAPGVGVFSSVTVPVADQQKYANWYAYYRTRELLMRTAAGRGFQRLGSDYRVGFTTISNTGAVNGATFLHVSDFDQAQKDLFFTKLYSAGAHSYTPLRGALAKAGQYFAHKVPGQDRDPVQYSCQRNYTILSTDGYWNNNIETASFGPYALDGSHVGQQDADELRPMQDGASILVTRVIDTKQIYEYPRTRNQTIKTTYTRKQVTVATNHSGCAATTYRGTTVTGQSRLETLIQPQTEPGSTAAQVFRQTIVTRNGVLQSDTSAKVGGLTTSFTNTWVNGAAATPTYASWAGGSSAATCKTALAWGLAGTPVGGGPYYTPDATGTAGSPVVTNSTPVNPAAVGSTIGGPEVTSDTSTSAPFGGSTDSLSDVAEYYYKTDLRSSALGNCSGDGGRDVCDNDTLSPVPGDSITAQHMSTSTIGIGTNGTLRYDPKYVDQLSGDFFNIKQGTSFWPVVAGGSPNAEAIDDLWHAAVNGRGSYFATRNSDSLADAIQKSLESVTAITGASSAAATTSLQPTKGEDNQVFIASFTTVDWTGELKSFPLNATDGTVDTANPKWSASDKLNQILPANRKIYYKAPSAPTLKNFTWANLNADGYGSNFANFCSHFPIPSQCAGYQPAQLTAANIGSNVVAYLRGDPTLEAPSGNDSVFRARKSRLGDIVKSEPVYVQKPPFAYSDVGYAAHASTWASRKAVVYAGSNDGMLHAFSADPSDGGTELWAYVPTPVMSSMYLTGDKDYEHLHSYRVDGAPVVADIYDKVGSQWHTILIAGLNSGGRAYYALDVTDPENPKALWEYSNANDADLGLTYGNPVVTKRADGTWVVAFASGYNNTGAGDGGGHLYVLNAYTGVRMLKISTGAGSTTTPSGLSKINVWLDSVVDNTGKRFYGADLLGNVWRFDVDNLVLPYQSATLLAQLKVAGVPQPVTTVPQLSTVKTAGGTRYPVVSVGTGRYLGLSDLGDKSLQTIYAIKDQLLPTGWGDFRTNGSALNETVALSGNSGTVGATVIDWSTQAGWYVDLPGAGERMAIDMVKANGYLIAISATPGGTDCKPVGSSVLYEINLTKGVGTVEKLGDFLVAGFSVIKVNSSGPNAADGTLKLVGVKGDSKPFTKDLGGGFNNPPGTQHRSSWRELVN